MRVFARLLVLGGLALTLGLVLLAGGVPGRAAGQNPMVWLQIIPDSDAKDLIKYLGQVEVDALKAGKGKTDKKDYENKITTVPLLIAVVTQSTKGPADSPEMAGFRAVALKASKEAQDGRVSTAQPLAAMLANLKPDTRGVGSAPTSLEDKGELLDYMSLLKLRSKGGIGFGLKPGLSSTTDGIESRLLGLQKRKLSDAEMKKQADDLRRMGYILAAISEVTDAHTPKKKQAGKDPKDWTQWTKDMRESALSFASAAQAKNADGVRTAARKLNASCNDCHGAFRD